MENTLVILKLDELDKILKRVMVVNGSVVVATFGPVVTSGFLVMQTVCRSSRHGFVDHHLYKINHMTNLRD